MKNYLTFSFLFFLIFSPLWATPEDELQAASPFKTATVAELSGGKILENRTGSNGSGKTQAVQTCFIIKAPMETVIAKTLGWNPESSSKLEVTLHQPLAHPVTLEGIDAFTSRLFRSSEAPCQWLVKTSQDANALNKNILLTSDEKAQITAAAKDKGALQKTWNQILFQRYQSFKSSGAPEFNQLNNFVGHLMKTGNATAPESASYYLELSDVNKTGVISSGVSWRTESGGHFVSDGEYYVSSEYLASFNQSEFWPVTLEGKEATLVWRIDSGYSDELDGLTGIDRMAASSLFLSSVKDTIEAMQKRIVP